MLAAVMQYPAYQVAPHPAYQVAPPSTLRTWQVHTVQPGQQRVQNAPVIKHAVDYYT